MSINDKGRDYPATAMSDNELDTVVGGAGPAALLVAGLTLVTGYALGFVFWKPTPK